MVIGSQSDHDEIAKETAMILVYVAIYLAGLGYMATAFITTRHADRKARPKDGPWPWWAVTAAAIVAVLWPLALLTSAAKASAEEAIDRIDDQRESDDDEDD